MLSTPTAIVVLAITYSVRVFCAAQDDGANDAIEWIRLCTLSRNGSSQINITMPCGVQVDGGYHGNGENFEKSVENARGNWKNAHGYVSKTAIVEEKNHRNPIDNLTDANVRASNHEIVDGDYVDDGLEMIASVGNVEEFDSADPEGENYEEDDVTVEVQDGVIDEGHDDVAVGAQDDGTVETQDDATVGAQDGATVEAQDDGHGSQDYGFEYQGGSMVTKVMVTYLLEAKNQLYNKINYLLNLLHHAFINAKLNHRSRRNLIERKSMGLNYAERRLQNKKKEQSFSSVMRKPTFERSMMTMSFLMFGVFIIQVVQRLMHTLHESGELSSNSVAAGNLPAAWSSLF